MYGKRITSGDSIFIRFKGTGFPSDGVCMHLFYSQEFSFSELLLCSNGL